MSGDQILFSINLHVGPEIRGFGKHVSWIQDPSPGLSASHLAISSESSLTFLGAAIASECGFHDSIQLLPGVKPRVQIDAHEEHVCPKRRMMVLGHYINVERIIQGRFRHLVRLIQEIYRPLSASLCASQLVDILTVEIGQDKRLRREIRESFQIPSFGLFRSQILGAEAISNGIGFLSKHEICALIWLTINVPRDVDRRSIPGIVKRHGIPTEYFGRNWEVLDLDPRDIKGPLSGEQALSLRIRQSAGLLHVNNHGLSAHPSPISFVEHLKPVFTPTSPFSPYSGGALNMGMPLFHEFQLDRLGDTWLTSQCDLGNDSARLRSSYIEFFAKNSWETRARELIALTTHSGSR